MGGMTRLLPRKLVWGLFLIIASHNFQVGSVWAQAGGSSKEFTHMGLISVSRNYSIAEDYSHITFSIKNNSSRTIQNIYGWVYRYNQAPNGKPFNLVLLNNPHKGGIVLNGAPHRPNEIQDWRFPLKPGAPPTEKTEKYTLKITNKSIFFSNSEPLKKSKTGRTPR